MRERVIVQPVSPTPSIFAGVRFLHAASVMGYKFIGVVLMSNSGWGRRD